MSSQPNTAGGFSNFSQPNPKSKLSDLDIRNRRDQLAMDEPDCLELDDQNDD